jgi:hypothetical protein
MLSPIFKRDSFRSSCSVDSTHDQTSFETGQVHELLHSNPRNAQTRSEDESATMLNGDD